MPRSFRKQRELKVLEKDRYLPVRALEGIRERELPRKELSGRDGNPILNLSSGLDLENLHDIVWRPNYLQRLRWDYGKSLLLGPCEGRRGEPVPCYTLIPFSAVHDEEQPASQLN